MVPKLGHESSFLFGWFRRPNFDLEPEEVLKRLHPEIQQEFLKRPKLRRAFEREMRMGLQQDPEDFRQILSENVKELNRVVEEEGPEHLQQLLKHAERMMLEQQAPTPLQLAQRMGIAMAPMPLSPPRMARLKDFL